MRPRIGLFGRIYAVSFALIVVYLVLVVVALKIPRFDKVGRDSARWLATDLLADCDDPARVARRAAQFAAATTYRVTVSCDGRRQLGAPATASPAALATADALPDRAGNREVASGHVFMYGRAARYAIVEDASEIPLPWEWMLAQLVVLAIVAWPVTRSLVRPLRALAAAMARFGAGDLAARAASQRTDEIGDLARGFDAMADRIAAAVRAEKLIVAGISHELRAPLHRITGALAAIPAGAPGSEAERARAAVTADVREISAMLDDVFLLARLDGPPTTIERFVRPQPTRVGDALEDALAGYAVHVPEAEVTLELDPAAARCELAADPRLVPRAVRNLVDNALKHAPGTPVAVRVGVVDGAVEIVVTDRGPGFPRALGGDALRPFVRGSDHTPVTPWLRSRSGQPSSGGSRSVRRCPWPRIPNDPSSVRASVTS
mgnify:FL=1